MLIKELELVGYKRLKLSNIHYLKITIQNLYQIILGTNGSGKSSLLDELTPLPANPADFIKGGKKRFVCEHNDHGYVLESTMGNKVVHSFLKNGEELNEGGTITVQKELVKREFGFTDARRDLMLGKMRFTEMSPIARRELITEMSDNDLTYAMNVYKQSVVVVRDNQGAIKHLKNRITKETENLRKLDDGEEIEETVRILQEELTVLMENRHPGLPKSSDIEHQLSTLMNEAMRVSDRILEKPIHQVSIAHFENTEELSDVVSSTKAESQAKQIMLDRYVDQHDKLVSLVGSLESTGVKDIGELKIKVNEIDTKINTLRKRIIRFQFDGDITDLELQAHAIKKQLVEVLSDLPDNSDFRYSRKALSEAEERIVSFRSKRDSAESKKKKTEQEIDHILTAKETKCPECGYLWKEGVSERDLSRLREIQDVLAKEAEIASQELEKTITFREEILEYSNQYSRFRSLAHSYPKANNLFDWLIEDNRIMFKPSSHTPIIDQWLNDLHIASEIWALTRELTIVQTAVNNAEVLSGTNAGQLQSSMGDLENAISNLTDEIRIARQQLVLLENHLHRVKVLEKDSEQLNQLVSKIVEHQKLHYECLRTEKLTELIRQHQSQLAIKTHRLSEKSALESIVVDLNRSLTDLELSHDTYKLLAQAMSPTDGVIADQMTLFIACMTEQVNDVIRQICTYPLEVIRCGNDDTESGELDYKFPLASGVSGNNAPDVSKGSKGQMEIVDFAFRLVALMYLGLNDYPLYVDELGENMDEQHRINVMNYIKLLIESHQCTQLFMISHFAVGHGSFNNADVLVLNGANITVPLRHNQNVIIE